MMPTHLLKLADLIDMARKQKKKPKHSYGIVAYLLNPFRVLLAHPGGPWHKGKDVGSWSIPKGLSKHGEGNWKSAVREFEEETNLRLPHGMKEKDAFALGSVTQKTGKIVTAWGVEMRDDNLSSFKSNKFKLKFTPSGKEYEFPEVDEVRYFPYVLAAHHIKPEQLALVDRLVSELGIIS